MKKQVESWWDFRSILWVLIIAVLVALRLMATQWVEDLYLFLYITLIALVLGLALGRSRFPGWASFLIGTTYGVFTLPALFALTLNPDISWYNRVVNILWFRLSFTLSQYINGQPITDSILFSVILAALFWFYNLFSGYILVRRGSTWGTLLPPALALMIISFYDASNPQTAMYVVFFVFFVLLIIGRQYYLHNQAAWKEQRIIPSPQVMRDLRRSLLVSTVVILAITWLIPLTASQVNRYSELWKNMTDPLKTLEDRINRILNPLEYETVGEDVSFNASLNLGRGTALGRKEVFNVSSSQDRTRTLRNYWKAQVYDIYRDDQWFIGIPSESKYLFPQDFSIDTADLLKREQITYTFDMQAFFDENIFTVNAPIWISRPVQATLVTTVDGFQEDLNFYADPPLQAEEIYQVTSWVGNPTRVELRASSNQYDSWLDRYLQLPEDLPEEISRLSAELTLGEDNPFDKAQAITNYLRQNITYSESIPTIPTNEDPIVWFLFEHKAGFCNYYATAEVLLLRAAGIPARLAVGYAQGEYDPATELYTVVQRNRHAWPEVYFNEYGWIEFEPTTSEPNIERPIGQVDIATTEPTLLPEIDDETTPTPTKPAVQPTPLPTELPNIPAEPRGAVLGTWVIILLMTMVFSFIAIWALTPQIRILPAILLLHKIWKTTGITVPGWLEKLYLKEAYKPYKNAYQVLTKSIKMMGGKINESDTVTERGDMLLAMLPDLEEDIHTLVHQVEMARYSHHEANINLAKEASLNIKTFVQATLIERRFTKKNR